MAIIAGVRGEVMAQSDRVLQGVMLMIGFCILAPLIDVSSKLAVATVSVGTVTLGRYVVQSLLMAPVMVSGRHSFALSGRAFWLLALRSFVSLLSTFAFVAALQFMPLADALAIAFVEPFFVLLIGHFVLHEQVGIRRLGACAVGFIGCLMVIQPSFAHYGAASLLPLVTAVSFAIYILLTRGLAPVCAPASMQFHTAWMGTVIGLAILLVGTGLGEESLRLEWPRGMALFWCFCMGLAATVSHMLMTHALRLAPSSTVAPLHYLEIVTATIFAYLAFGDFPNATTCAGIGVIVSSGLYIIYRERIANRAQASVESQPAR